MAAHHHLEPGYEPPAQRRTLVDIFEQSKKSKVPYADLVDQKVKTALGQAVETTVTRGNSSRRGRRHRRW